MEPAVFLDRDGVIIKNVETYVRTWQEVEFIPSSLDAVRRLSQGFFKIIIITNQSAVGRGIISLAEAEQISQKIVEIIFLSGGRIDGLYMCPHSPQESCDCRKPRPGLILHAARDLNLDLSRSVMIGDALSDVQAGQAAGIPTNILVKTGRGSGQLNLPLAGKLPPFKVCNELSTAVDWVLASF